MLLRWIANVAVVLTLLVGLFNGPVHAQGAGTTTLGPATVARLINAQLASATVRLNNRGPYNEQANNFFLPGDSFASILGRRRAIPIDQLDFPIGRTRYFYYVNDFNVPAGNITLAWVGGRYRLRLEFESAHNEIKGLCRYRKKNGDWTRCRPRGNDSPAPDANINDLSITIFPRLITRGGGIAFAVDGCQDINASVRVHLNGPLGWGPNNEIEQWASQILRFGIISEICNALIDDGVRVRMASRSKEDIASLPVFAGKQNVRAVRFNGDGSLLVQYDEPKVLDTSWHVNLTAQKSCPKEATVTVAIATGGPRSLDLRINRDGQVSKWFTVQAKKATIAGGEGYLALFNHTLGQKLGPGEKRLRLEMRGEAPTQWKSVKVSCPPFKVFSTWLKYEMAKTPYCPKQVKETVTFKATRPGYIPYRIKAQGGLVAREGITFAKREGDAYVAKVTRTLTMNEFDKDMMAEVKNDPSANSGWMRLKVDCLDVVGATLTLRDENGPSCTRQEKAAIAIRTDLEGPIPYRLDCTGGRSFAGTAAAYKTGNGTFIGVDTRKLAITKTEHINCALKTTINGKTKVAALRGHKYKCVNRNVGSPSDDVSSVPDPTHDRPNPTSIVDPISDFKCVNGRKVGGKCKCLVRSHRLVRLRGWDYHCIPGRPDVATAPPTRIPDPKIVSCRNGRKVKGKCKCRRGHRLVRLGSWHYRCVPGRPVAKGSDKTSRDAAADRRRREALKKAQEAKKRAEAQRKREKARKKAEEAKRKRDAAKKALEAKRKAAARRRSSMREAGKRRQVVR